MAYRIDYGPRTEERRTGGTGLFGIQIMTTVFLLLFILFVKQQWPEGSMKLREYLMPGMTAQESIFMEFVSEIQNGEPVGQALTTFCRSIVADANSD